MLYNAVMLFIRYRFDGKLFNLRRLKGKSYIQTDEHDKFLYADDMAENAITKRKMPGDMDRASQAYDNYDLTRLR